MRPNPLRTVLFQWQTATAPPKVFRKGEHIFLHFFHSNGVQVTQVNPFTNPSHCSGCSSLSYSAMWLPLSLQPLLAANCLDFLVQRQVALYVLTAGTQSGCNTSTTDTPCHCSPWPLPSLIPPPRALFALSFFVPSEAEKRKSIWAIDFLLSNVDPWHCSSWIFGIALSGSLTLLFLDPWHWSFTRAR